ncbi:MAG: zinc-finger domain-containing protein [Sphingomonadales bacterium]|nr:zinc-finger domain-containing protein [Sphingomonadales bacterium]
MAQNSSKKQTIAQPDVVYCEQATVSCDGGVGSLGHPRVYLSMDASGQASCTYCGKSYIKTGSACDKR